MRHSISGCNFCAKISWNRTEHGSNFAPPCFIPSPLPYTKIKCNSKLWRYVSIQNGGRTNQKHNKCTCISIKSDVYTFHQCLPISLMIEKIFKFLFNDLCCLVKFINYLTRLSDSPSRSKQSFAISSPF